MSYQRQRSQLADDRLQREFASRLRARDLTVIDELLSCHQAAVFRFARSITGRDSDAEDVLQQTFLSALQHGASFRGEASLRSWLLRIARNEALRVSRVAARHEEAVNNEDLFEIGKAAGWGSESPESLVSLAERGAVLSEALASLPSSLCEILVLRDLEQCSGQEASEILGISMTAMKSRLHRARLSLAQAIRRGGIDE